MCRLLRILLFSFLALLFAVAPAMAASVDGLSLRLDAGYRLDEVDWNIDGGVLGPNIISELEWEDLEIFQIRAGGRLDIGNGAAPFPISVKGEVAYGWIVDGENQDSDFAGDDRTEEYSRSNNNAGDGDVFDLTGGIGPRFTLVNEKLTITPMAGYSYHEQNLRMADGFQTIATDGLTPPPGPFPGLDSTYETQWYGPWAGVDMELLAGREFRLYGSFEYHWVDFEAEADWNLRGDLAHPVSFRHEEADGEGIVLSLGGAYDLTDRWYVHLDVDYQEWKAEDGRIRFLYQDGGEQTQGLNEVNWESWAAMVGVTYRFL